MNSRRAFTIIELLVTMAVIGILMALLVPAVQQAREAARRAVCQSHMRQLGIALVSYHDAHKILPPATLWRGNNLACPSDNCGSAQNALLYGPSWLVMLLPFADQTAVYDQLDLSIPLMYNAGVIEARIPTYLCPSDAFNDTPHIADEHDGVWQRGNYGANLGKQLIDSPSAISTAWSALAPDQQGPMGNSGAARFSDIDDGTSNTVAVWEIRAGTYAPDARGVWALSRGCIVGSCDDIFDCHGINDSTIEGEDVYGCVPDPTNGMDCYPFADAQWAPRSMHPGGAHAMMADGSVRFVNENISMQIMRDLGSIYGKETIGEF